MTPITIADRIWSQLGWLFCELHFRLADWMGDRDGLRFVLIYECVMWPAYRLGNWCYGRCKP